jgi:hypothetical protein
VPVLTGAVLPDAVKSTDEFTPEEDNLPKTPFGPFTVSWALPRLASASTANARVITFIFMACKQLLSRP